jgi:hypothetical protein
MAAWPNLAEVRKLLRLQPDVNEDAVISTALAAAVDYGMGRLGGSNVLQSDGVTLVWTWTYPAGTTTLPDSGHEACLLDAARLYRRRDSIDGTIGFGDMGAIRVGRTDADVERLYARCGPLVFG